MFCVQIFVNDFSRLLVLNPTARGAFAGNGGDSADHINTAEQVTFPASATSSMWLHVPYIIRVKGTAVIMAPQNFALVASGPIVEAERVNAGTGRYHISLFTNA